MEFYTHASCLANERRLHHSSHTTRAALPMASDGYATCWIIVQVHRYYGHFGTVPFFWRMVSVSDRKARVLTKRASLRRELLRWDQRIQTRRFQPEMN